MVSTNSSSIDHHSASETTIQFSWADWMELMNFKVRMRNKMLVSRDPRNVCNVTETLDRPWVSASPKPPRGTYSKWKSIDHPLPRL